MANHFNSSPEILFNLLYVVLSIAVSALYWLKDANTGFKHIAVSVHSVLMLVLISGALYLGFKGYANPEALWFFYLLLVLPILSIVASFRYFTGMKWVHISQIWKFAALVWTWFIGSMAVTGDWL